MPEEVLAARLPARAVDAAKVDDEPGEGGFEEDGEVLSGGGGAGDGDVGSEAGAEEEAGEFEMVTDCEGGVTRSVSAYDQVMPG